MFLYQRNTNKVSQIGFLYQRSTSKSITNWVFISKKYKKKKIQINQINKEIMIPKYNEFGFYIKDIEVRVYIEFIDSSGLNHIMFAHNSVALRY